MNRASRRQVISTLIEALADASEGVRKEAARSLARMGSQPDVLTALRGALHDNNDSVRYRASQALRLMNLESTGLLDDVMVLLDDKIDLVRLGATEVLARWPIPAAVPRLIGLMKDRDERIRRVAIRSLGRMPSAAKSAVRHLVEALMDSSETVRMQAVDSLTMIAEQFELVPVLIEALQNDNAAVRLGAAHVLLRLGKRSARALPALLEHVEDIDERVRRAIVCALAAFEDLPATATPELIRALGDRNSSVRQSAVQVLGGMGD